MIPSVFSKETLNSIQSGVEVLADALAIPAKKIAGIAKGALFETRKATTHLVEKLKLAIHCQQKKSAAAQTFSDNLTKKVEALDEKKSSKFFSKLNIPVWKFDKTKLTQHLEDRNDKQAFLDNIDQDLNRFGAEDRIIIFPNGNRVCYSLTKLKTPAQTILNDLRKESALSHLTEDQLYEILSFFGQATQRVIYEAIFQSVGNDFSAVPGSTIYALSTLDLSQPQSPKIVIESTVGILNMSKNAQLNRTIDLKTTIHHLSAENPTVTIEAKEGAHLPNKSA